MGGGRTRLELTNANTGRVKEESFSLRSKRFRAVYSQVAKGSDLYRADKSTKLCMVVA